jgi:hypothetical protein
LPECIKAAHDAESKGNSDGNGDCRYDANSGHAESEGGSKSNNMGHRLYPLAPHGMAHETKKADACTRVKFNAELFGRCGVTALGKSHVARKAWEWGKDSPALAEARKVIAS